MKDSVAREAILRYFPDPPTYSAEDLGVLLRLSGRDYFVEVARVLEITASLPVSRLPGLRGRGISFWRGSAHEVRGESFEEARGFVLIKRARGDFFIASETDPVAISRKEMAVEAENYPEEE